MTFKDLMESDMQDMVLNIDEFAEEITYVTKAGVESTINAIVERELLEPVAGGGNTRTKIIDITIANDAAAGVTSVDTTGDFVKVPVQIGEDAEEWRITEILSVDDGAWQLRCIK